jgi:hypothetical protein
MRHAPFWLQTLNQRKAESPGVASRTLARLCDPAVWLNTRKVVAACLVPLAMNFGGRTELSGGGSGSR